MTFSDHRSHSEQFWIIPDYSQDFSIHIDPPWTFKTFQWQPAPFDDIHVPSRSIQLPSSAFKDFHSYSVNFSNHLSHSVHFRMFPDYSTDSSIYLHLPWIFKIFHWPPAPSIKIQVPSSAFKNFQRPTMNFSDHLSHLVHINIFSYYSDYSSILLELS